MPARINTVRTRRGFLRDMARLGAAGLLSPVPIGLLNAQSAQRVRSKPKLPIENILICCNENRSFDHYFGYASFAGKYGVPAGYSQPTGVPGFNVSPFDVNSTISPDPHHDWATIHGDWDGGKLDGFVTSGGAITMSYTDASQLGYYYSLFSDFTLCVNYFCSMLGSTFFFASIWRELLRADRQPITLRPVRLTGR